MLIPPKHTYTPTHPHKHTHTQNTQGYVKRDAQQRPQQKARIVVLNSNAGVVPGQPNASCASSPLRPVL